MATSRADTATSFLHAHGLSTTPAKLDAMVREAVARLRRGLYRSDARADLTEAEAAALEAGGFVLEASSEMAEDPLAQTVAEYAALLKTSLTTAEAARRLGVDPSRVRQRLTARPSTLYGIRTDSGWVLPEFQFEGGGLLPGLAEVVSRLDPELHPVSVERWFTLPSVDLVTEGGRRLSPRDWLRAGYPPVPVAELAENL